MASFTLNRIFRGAASRSSHLLRRAITNGSASNAAAAAAVVNPSRKFISPWLMLPPALEEGEGKQKERIHRFYRLGENQVLSVRGSGGRGKEVPDDDAVCMGSSRGWLGYLNRRNTDLFLSNPLTGCHMKLPSIDPLLSVFPASTTRGPGVAVEKLIITSPDPQHDQDCRALIMYGASSQLAYCCPGRTGAWTPIRNDIRSYEHFVYSGTEQLFYCYDTDMDLVEAWDLRDPSSPRMVPIGMLEVYDDEYDHEDHPVPETEPAKWESECDDERIFLMEHGGELFGIRRFIMDNVDPNGSLVEEWDSSLDYPHMTPGFDAFRYDKEAGRMRYLERSLDGLAFFIGANDSFALSARDFPGLKPDSIYFTDDHYSVSYPGEWGGHDNGIFNYQDKTMSPLYNYTRDPAQFRPIYPTPMWFLPNPSA